MVAMGRGALALLAVIAALGVPCASAAACINQDAGSELWDGVCLYIEQQPNPRAMCDEIIRVDGLPPDMCCVCGISFGDLQKALPPLCKVSLKIELAMNLGMSARTKR